MTIQTIRGIAALALILMIGACGNPSDEAEQADFEMLDNTAEVEAYYASKPDFFSFKTLADLPTDLDWQDGSHLAEVGSADAIKGGTEYARLQDFPRTLRTVGPGVSVRGESPRRPWLWLGCISCD